MHVLTVFCQSLSDTHTQFSVSFLELVSYLNYMCQSKKAFSVSVYM